MISRSFFFGVALMFVSACGLGGSDPGLDTSSGLTAGAMVGATCSAGGECQAFACTCADGTQWTTARYCLNRSCQGASSTCSNACKDHGGGSAATTASGGDHQQRLRPDLLGGVHLPALRLHLPRRHLVELGAVLPQQRLPGPGGDVHQRLQGSRRGDHQQRDGLFAVALLVGLQRVGDAVRLRSQPGGGGDGRARPVRERQLDEHLLPGGLDELPHRAGSHVLLHVVEVLELVGLDDQVLRHGRGRDGGAG